MVSIEQVEKLLQYADVSYEEARDALESCNGSLLDAIVLLERQGKVRGGKGGAVPVLPGNEQEHENYNHPTGENFVDTVKRGLKWVGESFDNIVESIGGAGGGNRRDETYSDEQRRDGESEKL
jgi:hypothetical protein